MSEKPILFSTPMVQAILAGRKTQTRRIFKYPQNNSPMSSNLLDGVTEEVRETIKDSMAKYCHYQTGNVLWVRETWCRVEIDGDYAPPIYQGSYYYYKADDNGIEACGAFDKWRSSIHMPRAAARIFLRVTDVRVERVCEISNTDCIREGMNNECCRVCIHTGGSGCAHCNGLWTQFKDLWDNLNAKKEGCSWGDNPWVWKISFERAEV